MKVLIAGGGTAGHIEPALNTADALRDQVPGVEVLAVGTERGLESQLVPERGYEFVPIPAYPLPRTVNRDLVATPRRLRAGVKACRRIVADRQIDVVVGFGGYVSMPPYFAARGQVPLVVHEANARAGLANRLARRWAAAVAEAYEGSLPGAERIGIPLQRRIADLDRAAQRQPAAEHFALDPAAPTLLVFGGSLGARKLNDAVLGSLPALSAAGIQVLHIAGKKNNDQSPDNAPQTYRRLTYCDRMDLAYAVADVAVCRAGAVTCAELATVGLPAVYVPLPSGNGEQRLNAIPTVQSGGGVLVSDVDLDPGVLTSNVLDLFADPDRIPAMARAAMSNSSRSAAVSLAAIVVSVASRGALR